MRKSLQVTFLLLAASSLALAIPPAVPEIDGSSTVTAISLLCGVLMLIPRRKK